MRIVDLFNNRKKKRRKIISIILIIILLVFLSLFIYKYFFNGIKVYNKFNHPPIDPTNVPME